MNISFGQVLVILIVGFLLFGNLPKKFEEWTKTAKIMKKDLMNLKDEKEEKKNVEGNKKEERSEEK